MKSLLYRLTSLIFLLLAMGITSCCSDSNDGNDEPQISVDNEIVGIWVNEDNYEAFDFKSDGTGMFYSKEIYEVYSTRIEWKYENNVITWYKPKYAYDEDGYNYLEVKKLTSTTMLAVDLLDASGGYPTIAFFRHQNLSFLNDWK